MLMSYDIGWCDLTVGGMLPLSTAATACVMAISPDGKAASRTSRCSNLGGYLVVSHRSLRASYLLTQGLASTLIHSPFDN
jgi:hypothetical protein